MSICALGLRVGDAAGAFARALDAGAWPFEGGAIGPMELNIPAIQGIGQSVLYFIDRWRGKEGQAGDVGDISIYDVDFRSLPHQSRAPGAGLTRVDHLTQAVERALAEWLEFYRRCWASAQWARPTAPARHMPRSRPAAASASRSMKGTERHDQMRGYLSEQHGEGIQHIALATGDIRPARPRWRKAGSSSCSRRRPTTIPWTRACRAMASTRRPCAATASADGASHADGSGPLAAGLRRARGR